MYLKCFLSVKVCLYVCVCTLGIYLEKMIRLIFGFKKNNVIIYFSFLFGLSYDPVRSKRGRTQRICRSPLKSPEGRG